MYLNKNHMIDYYSLDNYIYFVAFPRNNYYYLYYN